MKLNGFLKFLVFGAASTALMGVVFNSNAGQSHFKPFYNTSGKVVLPVDTPEKEIPLPYKFKDNNGRQPQFDDKNKLYLEDPSNVKTNTEYDPKTGNYNVTQKMGDMRYRPDTYIDFQDYQDYMFKKSVHDYWRSRIKAEDLNQPKKGIVPKLQINNELFDRIFGGNTVDIRPTGTVELIFGLNRNKTLNPAIPQRQQKVTNFDFNMRIQLNLIGKIGDKLKITTNYNTEASFDWENQIKLDYTGYEDEIIKKIEAGNVTLPLNSTLITGSQSLFGIKTQMQFGKLNATTILSQQRGKKQEVTVQGGAQTQFYNINADSYESNKHFFLGHFFKDNYDAWMATLPIMNTPVVITKVEVYILNQTGNTEQTRNIMAFEDLGEDSANVFYQLRKDVGCLSPSTYAIEDSAGVVPSNGANNLYYLLSDPTQGILKDRDASTAPNTLKDVFYGSNICSNTGYMVQGRDFDKIMNARKLKPEEFTLNNRLGYISLNQSLNNDQALAVSYQLTYNGKTYQVGEFTDQFPDPTKSLFCKLLRPAAFSVRFPTWQLMMKNVYSIGAYNLNAQDFRLDVFYNNIETGVDIPYLPFGSVNGRQLIQVLDCDKISVNGDKYSDGVYDFFPGFTINPANGRIYFNSVEPFGSKLRSKFDPNNDFPTANKYVFQELYDSTRVSAQNLPEKNRYKIKGSYKSASGSEISLNALNIPQGAVVVTANGVKLTENTDYTVDYTLGRVKIINESILNSGAQINVSVESNSLFNIQQKSLIGTRLDYKVNRDLLLGGTFLRFSEKPVTQKVNTGDEPVSNIVYGLDYNYKTEAPILTRLIDRLPLISTKEMSSITTQGEFAHLIPGNASAIGKGGNSYIDDFEGSVSLIDIRNPTAWSLASIPQGQPSLFPEANFSDTILAGINRARFNWYTIDPALTRQQTGGITPSYYNKNIYSNNLYRQVLETELFPGKTPPNGQPVVLPVLEIGFYPEERGPYNMDVYGIGGFSSGIDLNTGKLKSPQSRWGGIMRRLETNDFQAANVEYIQFWMMDPFNEDYNSTTHPDMDATKTPSGDLYINIGNVSEDIVKDGRMAYENGVPGVSSASADLPVTKTNVSFVPLIPPVANAFSADPVDRPFQDVGYDGMNNDMEKERFNYLTSGLTPGNELIDRFINDPSSDDYHFFRGDDYDSQNKLTLDRYRFYNNAEGNSPTEQQYKSQNSAGYPTGATTLPNIEDINRDNTLSETENYYQYRIRISKQDLSPSNVGNNFIVDQFEGVADVEGVKKTVKWYQFKVPVSQFENAVGGIEGFNSIRFMRVFMKGFDKPVVLRIARLEMVRSDWRRYQFDLTKPGEYLASDDNTTAFDVSGVSIQENAQKIPVNYVIPPNIQQQQNIQTTNLVLQNEQALQLRTSNLKDGDSRAIFKNVDLDVRMFKRLKMFVHASQLNKQPLNDGDVTLFVRLGTDYNNNYYEYEIPLSLTKDGYYDPNNDNDKYIVWPTANEVNISFEALTQAKEQRNLKTGKDLTATSKPFEISDPENSANKIIIVGNPNLGTLKSIMIGVRNPKDNGAMPRSVEVWVNELRLTDFNNKGGWATTGRVQAKLADLGQVSLAATYSKPFFGSVEKKINERSKETTFNWDFASTFQLGKFFPAKWKVALPLYYSYGETRITPLFNPFEPDVRMDALKSSENGFSDNEVKQLRFNALDYTQRKGFNLTNVRIDGLKKPNKKPMPWDVSNFSFTYAYTEMFKRNVNIEHSTVKQYRGNASYGFQLKPKSWKPFEKMKIFDNKWLALIKEFNLQPLPNRFGVTMDIMRNYSELLNRDITSFYTNDFNRTLTQYNKQFLINRNYDFRWDLTKSFKFDYMATNEGRVLEPFGAIDTKEKKDTVKSNLKGFGTNIAFRQQFNINGNIPINKIPIFDFINVTTRYSGSYTWTRRPFAAEDSIGNTAQNTNSKNYTANFNMMSLYNKIPYFRKINQGIPTGKGSGNKKTNNAADTSKKKAGSENFKDIAEFLARGVMMIKNVSLSYQSTNGTALPNFKPSSQYLGMDWGNKYAPGMPFILGSQDTNIRNTAAQNGWLARNMVQTQPFTQTRQENFTYRASVEPHGSLKIELNGNLTKSSNYSAYMRWDTIIAPDMPVPGFRFNESPSETGNFSISAFTLGKSFKDKGKGVESSLFKDFLNARQDYGRLLSEGNANSAGSKTVQTITGGTKSYFDGYNETQQDVLIGAFYEAYTGKKINKYSTKNIFPSIPMPNWTVSWDGLGKLKPLKKTFRSITLRHGYRSTYNVGGYSNNLLWGEDPFGTNTRSPVQNPIIGTSQQTENFNPKYNITSVVLSESFSPLIKLDMQFKKPGWQGNFEIKKDKTVTLNLTGPQIIETKGNEVVVGAGYRYPKLVLKKVKIQGKPVQSDLNVKLDISYRQNISIIRRIADEISTPTGGANIISLRSAVDYQLTPNINLRFFYDWIRTSPQTTASFPTANTNGGFSLRINLQ